MFCFVEHEGCTKHYDEKCLRIGLELAQEERLLTATAAAMLAAMRRTFSRATFCPICM